MAPLVLHVISYDRHRINMFFVKDDKNDVPEKLNAMLGKKLPQHAAGTISTLVTVEKEGDSKKKPGQQRYSRYTVIVIQR